MQQASRTKVFGIGLSKTGTTSLAHALEILGYKTIDYLGATNYVRGDLSSIDLQKIENNDAFTDTPIPSFYRELDKRYPHSKFILTVREIEGWLRSCKKQFTKKHAQKINNALNVIFKEIYDCIEYDAENFESGYRRFNEGVIDYFKERKEDLLILDIAAGEGWEELCDFLDKPIPQVPFPKRNVTKIQWIEPETIVSVAGEAGKEVKK